MAEEEHLELSRFIKGVHENLRMKCRSIGWERAWIQHRNEREILEEYAAAMHKLATKYWEKNAKGDINNRIEWVVKKCQWYFSEDGQKEIVEQDLIKISRIEGGESKESFINRTHEIHELSFNKPLLMLDVGSCYNPFKHFSIFKTLALDLAPATYDVFQCDFLEVEIIKNKVLVCPYCGKINESSSLTCDISESKSHTIRELPAGSFDVVNFSLFLEYLPSSHLRYDCCVKAFNLLKPGGLLFIVTPDSKHASANAPVMRSWRISLGTIGFSRVLYQKLTHLHCMAFRKCPVSVLQNATVTRSNKCAKTLPSEMIVIPQDFVIKTDESETSSNTNTGLNSADVNFFAELPISY